MRWTDSEEIGLALFRQSPDQDPLAIRFTDLRDRVISLDGFDDDPRNSNEARLEAIQMAWLEEHRESLREREE